MQAPHAGDGRGKGASTCRFAAVSGDLRCLASSGLGMEWKASLDRMACSHAASANVCGPGLALRASRAAAAWRRQARQLLPGFRGSKVDCLSCPGSCCSVPLSSPVPGACAAGRAPAAGAPFAPCAAAAGPRCAACSGLRRREGGCGLIRQHAQRLPHRLLSAARHQRPCTAPHTGIAGTGPPVGGGGRKEAAPKKRSSKSRRSVGFIRIS